MPMHSTTRSSPQATPSGKRTKETASCRTESLPSRVPCGIATPSPTYVDTDRSRWSIVSTYDGSTAPAVTSASPHWRMASSRPVAVASRRTARRSSSSGTALSAVLDRGDEPGHRGVAEEELELHDRLVTGARGGAVGESLVTDDHVGVVRDGVDRGVLDGHRVLLQLLAQLAGQHDAAAHARVAGDDDLLDVLAVHRGSRSM